MSIRAESAWESADCYTIHLSVFHWHLLFAIEISWNYKL